MNPETIYSEALGHKCVSNMPGLQHLVQFTNVLYF